MSDVVQEFAFTADELDAIRHALQCQLRECRLILQIQANHATQFDREQITRFEVLLERFAP